MRTATAIAPANIALVKYWGKRDVALNLPATSSLSMTLSTMRTTTSVTFDAGLKADEMDLCGTAAPPDVLARASRFLDLVREAAGLREFARVVTSNDFPTAAGLASSASGFAALALASCRASGMETDIETLSALARRGSGSAPRSLLGGLVGLEAGTAPDGSDCIPYQIAPPGSWDLGLVIGVCEPGGKGVGSTEGMERTRLTSPYYEAWLSSNRLEFDAAKRAVTDRDFTALGRTAERSCFRMHAAAMACDPPVLYWNATTLGVIGLVHAMRRDGIECWVTVDAGPHACVLCRQGDSEAIAREVAAVPGVVRAAIESPGKGAEVVE